MNFLKKTRGALRNIYFILYPTKGFYSPTFYSWWIQSRFVLWTQLWVRFIFFVLIKGGKISEISTSNNHGKVLSRVIFLNHKDRLDIIKLNRTRLEMMAGILKAIFTINTSIPISTARLLSIGPKNEGELLLYSKYGFNWDNLVGIDLSSYSPKIKLMDMHEIKFPDNTFDVVTSMWSIRYSYDLSKVTNEIKRVAKDGALIAVGITYSDDKDLDFAYESKLDSINSLLEYFDGMVSNIYWRIEDEKKPNKIAHMSVVFRIRKDE